MKMDFVLHDPRTHDVIKENKEWLDETNKKMAELYEKGISMETIMDELHKHIYGEHPNAFEDEYDIFEITKKVLWFQ